MKINEKEIIKIIAEELDVNEYDIDLNSSFENDLGADSLDICQIIMRLEEKYKMTIDDEDIMNIKTVGDAINYIEMKI